MLKLIQKLNQLSTSQKFISLPANSFKLNPNLTQLQKIQNLVQTANFINLNMSQNNKNFNIFKNGQPDILESATHETSVSHSQESYENQANKISPKENLARRGRSNLKSPERTPGSLKRLRSERSVSPSVSENGSFCESEVSFCMSSYESRRRKNAPIRIAIEGNIAAGKSTFIKILEDISMDDPNCNWFIQPEPLEKWTKEKQSSLNDSSSSLKTPEKTSRQAQNTSLSPLQALSQPTESQKRTQRRSTQGGNNLLEKFYKDPQRWAYTFEAYTFMTRMKQALDADRQVKKEFGNEFSQENNNFSAITFFERSVYWRGFWKILW